MKPDPVTTLVNAAETLRAVARDLEDVQLGGAEARADLRQTMGDLRRTAFGLITLAAIELRPAGATLAAAE